MVSGMTSSPDALLSQAVIVTESSLVSYSKTEGRWLHPERIKASDIDNRSARLIMKTMSAARRRGHYKTLTRLHRHPHPSAGTRVRCTGLLLFDAFTNELSDLFIREIKDGIAISGFRLSVGSLRNQ